MRSIASALFGVLATVGGVPIIRALPGGPAQMIAEQLSKVCDTHVEPFQNISAFGLHFFCLRRPLLMA